MKFKSTLLALAATSLGAFAQAPILLHNNLDNNNAYDEIEDIEYYNTDIYYSAPEEGKILKVSMVTPNSPVVEVLSGLSFPSALAVVGDELYFIETANAAMQPNTGKLSKINLSQVNPAVTTLYSTLHYPIELAMNGTTAYVGETYMSGPIDDFEVEHMELSVVIGATKTVLYNNYDYIDDIEYLNNAVYIVNYNETTDATAVDRLDVTNNTPGTPQLFWADSNSYYPYNLEVTNNFMYLNGDFEGAPIIQIFMSNPSAGHQQTNTAPFTFNGNNVYANEMIVVGDNMFVLGEAFDSVNDVEDFVLFDVPLVALSTDEFAINNEVNIAPNPATDSFSISKYENGSGYSIYSLDGKLIKQGTYEGAVSVTGLSAGMYILNLENGKSLKIQKSKRYIIKKAG